jgi:hypothetical protein
MQRQLELAVGQRFGVARVQQVLHEQHDGEHAEEVPQRQTLGFVHGANLAVGGLAG